MIRFALFGTLLLVGLSGCGRGVGADGKMAYSGTVTWNGTPLEKGTLLLTAADGDLDAAKIQQGTFEVRTRPGSKFVSVSAERFLGTPSATPADPFPAAVTFQYLPESVNKNSEIKTEVEEGATSITIELTGKELEPSAELKKRLEK